MSSILDKLNEKQLAAVTAPHQHHLVLAGAGSGKTRVLVHRMAWLMNEQGVSPFAILAVTFTNKAAHEMRGRIETLRGVPSHSLWVGTFHGLAHRLLRLHWQEANLPENFQILDSDDQLRLIKRIQKEREIDDTRFPSKQVQWFINKAKEEGRRPSAVGTGDYFNDTMQMLYQEYHDACERGGLVDFSELLLRSLETLKGNPNLRQHYQERFLHILVDEFQDTNTIQYQWLSLLCGESCAIMAVGDDDQSIYSWRGAQIENINRFTREFQPCDVIRLEQNYRSTQNILDAANAVIANNAGRMGKKLWTQGKTGDLLTLYAAFNEFDEAHYITSVIRDLVRLDSHYGEVAILYRSNAQSRVLEESLLKAAIPYRIYGGQKFFDRAEIKDVLAYLRLVLNRHDDNAFERVVNLPTRGIGNTTLTVVRQCAIDLNTSLWSAAQHMIESDKLNARAKSCLAVFLNLITHLDDQTHGAELQELTQYVIDTSGLIPHFQKDRSEKGQSRLENIDELITATSQFKADEAVEELSPLAAFLSHVALETGDNQAEAFTESVSLMTLHASKGLEFPIVFLTGMEESLFPHRMSTEEPQGLEEERRLCYVGMTRAKQKLYLTHAATRRVHGNEHHNTPSRFINEVPEELVHAIRPRAAVRPHAANNWNQANAYSSTATMKKLSGQDAGDSGLQVGQRVAHPKFGEGVILNYEGSGSHTRVQIKFKQHGPKWLVASFAKLQAI